MVRLKAPIVVTKTKVDTHFNSTMVRLKDELLASDEWTNKFQFHYGTIKRKYREAIEEVRNAFQFHYGTIKRMAAVFIKVLL